jgi:GT2 family glycosyltransferase
MDTRISTFNKTKDQNITETPVISIILVCWNNKKYLDPCLESIYDGRLRSAFEILVVDNGSTDGSQEMLRDKFPQVKIIQNDHNVGLGRASNQGIEASSGKYILLLNNDTLVDSPSFDTMVNFLDEHSEVGAVGGKLLNPDGSVQACYNNFSTLMEEFLIATRLGELFNNSYPSIVNDDQIKSVDWISSACLMLRRETLNQIGLLDEEYFIYGDEADLQYRLKKGGWLVYYLPNATTVHFGGRSMDRWRRRKMVYRGKMLFYRKSYGAFRTFILRLMLAVLSFGKLILWSIFLLFPARHDRAKKEIHSNFEVIQLCVKLN